MSFLVAWGAKHCGHRHGSVSEAAGCARDQALERVRSGDGEARPVILGATGERYTGPSWLKLSQRAGAQWDRERGARG